MGTIRRLFETFCKNGQRWKGEISRFGKSDILLLYSSGRLVIVVCLLTTSVIVNCCYHVFMKFRCVSTRFFQLKSGNHAHVDESTHSSIDTNLVICDIDNF